MSRKESRLLRALAFVTLALTMVMGCSSSAADCYSKGLGVDAQGRCAQYCGNTDAGNGGCASDELCKELPQPSTDPHSNIFVTAFVCCSGDGC